MAQTNVQVFSGNVGIGVTTPDGPLHISKSAPYNGDTGPGILFTRYSNTYGGCIWNESNNDIDGLYFNAVNNVAGAGYGSTPKMVINSNGNVGIGLSDPTYKLDILDRIRIRGNYPALYFSEGTGAATQPTFRIYNDGASQEDGNNYLAIQKHTTGGVYNSIIHARYSGDVGIGTNNPGGKLDVNGSILGAYNTDTTSYFGRSAVGHVGHSDWAGFAHIDRNNQDDYALLQNSAGRTIINCKSDRRISFSSGDVETMCVKGSEVGIGTNSLASKLTIKQSANSYTNAISIERSNSADKWYIFQLEGKDLEFNFNGAQKGFLHWNQNVGIIDFTGQHRNFIHGVSYTNYDSLEGLIVSANKNKYYDIDENVTTGANAIQISQSLPLVALSTTEKDKACFGVISGVEDPDTRKYEQGTFVTVLEKQRGDRRAFINSLGEGAIWVTNINGPLESGDYITTSNVAGYGQKQDSEFLANYTVAKITMDCDFEPATQPVQIIRKEMGDVNYWVKTTYENISEEEYSNLTEENRRTITETVYTNEEGEITQEQYNTFETDIQSTYTELIRTVYQRIKKEESKTEHEGWELEVRQELVNVLDEHSQIQWEDDPYGATEKAYKIRYLDVSGAQTDSANAVHIAAFVGCTYHCG